MVAQFLCYALQTFCQFTSPIDIDIHVDVCMFHYYNLVYVIYFVMYTMIWY